MSTRQPAAGGAAEAVARSVALSVALAVALSVAVTYVAYVALPGRAGVGAQVAEQLVRAAGFAALGYSYAGLALGLVAGARGVGGASRQRLLRWHRQTNLVALALVVVHLTAFVVAPGGSLLVALVPQTAQVGATAYTLGVIGLYLALLLGPTWYLRDRIGRWAWLVLHQFAALSYAAGLLHTLLLGGDVRADGPIRTWFWVLQLPLLGLFWLRLARPRRPADHVNAALREKRFATPRHGWFRFAVHTGALVTVVLVCGVVVAALRDGLHATR